ncbi:hypothetical protein HN51_070750 [Arachis hypogaea]|uniref:C2 NT-type domain-containing protein n=1 Tax=Arachis hypogaea TaxID=3818 RepID=A0A444Z0W7_ARAHY|nr:protein PLASTID MOVEMENT IMPAIRED 1-like [Arachis ipaensis]XP_025655797.1 protein PLASTID MOVEMENT IMPAIRED 1-like [Arachis hypogaea]QHO13189.1 uncharacterized protein DS421_15g513340 [Arachis hypogaea]RYR07808.1 hypothetical protein Ahy_B05g075258 [Arachis hypogaea]
METGNYSYSPKRNSNARLLEELEALSKSLYQSHTARRTASLALPRDSAPPPVKSVEDDNASAKIDIQSSNKPRTRRLSLSPWRSRPKREDNKAPPSKPQQTENLVEKRGIWSWKPMRALSHITMQKLSCLFSVEVVTAQNLPSSMNGLRLSVCVRKKETKDGAVQTMPSRVVQGAADFEETLFIRCHVYCNHGSGKQLKFEPRPFYIYLVAVDAKELNFGRTSVDLSRLVQESIEKSWQGTRVRQWETSFSLCGKAKGGELVLKFGFQIMEKDGAGIAIYNQDENLNSKSSRFISLASSFRKQSKRSFSVPSARITSRNDAWTPSDIRSIGDFHGLHDLSLDDTISVQDSSASVQKLDDGKEKVDDFHLLDFDIVDKGVEVQKQKKGDGEESERSVEVKSASSEVVKEIVHDQLHLTRLTELDSIAQQLKALETMIGEDINLIKARDTDSQRLDSDEETVTREFLQILEDKVTRRYKINQSEIPPFQLEGHAREHGNEDSSEKEESKVYLPHLGKGLGCVIQTKDGGYLASMNPLDSVVARNDTPKLAMQMSKPFVLQSHQFSMGLELFQKLVANGIEDFSSEVLSLMPIDEMIGKSAEQVAFEGIASAIIQGRNKEGASSSAARIVSALNSMANAMSSGRKERISTGLWNIDENPLTAEQILAFTMQKIESMAIEALKIQADMAEEEAPFDVSVTTSKEENNDKDLLSSAISLEDWVKDQSYNETSASSYKEASHITLIFVVQLRDPKRRYEAVGGPMMVLVHATADTKRNEYNYDHEDGEEQKFKVTNMDVGGFKVRSGVKNYAWDGQKQRLTAMQWLVEYGLGKAGKKIKNNALIKGQDSLWSISSNIMGDMWLNTMRNPDIKLVVNQ